MAQNTPSTIHSPYDFRSGVIWILLTGCFFPIQFSFLFYFYQSTVLSSLQAYRASMLKAFKKTLEEGVFTFIIGMSFHLDFSVMTWNWNCSPWPFSFHFLCVVAICKLHIVEIFPDGITCNLFVLYLVFNMLIWLA